MKKTYTIQGLDCGSCAAKIEEKIAKLDGVKNVQVNFMLEKLVLEAEDDAFADVLQQAKKIADKVEPGSVIVGA